jgi:hypothetical protein
MTKDSTFRKAVIHMISNGKKPLSEIRDTFGRRCRKVSEVKIPGKWTIVLTTSLIPQRRSDGDEL